MSPEALKINVCEIITVRDTTPERVLITYSPPVFVWDFAGLVVSADSTWAPTFARAPSFGTQFPFMQSA